MIYLIGGAPKCGKTTLAKKLSSQKNISWIATDTLQVVASESLRPHVSKKAMDALYPHNAMKGKNNDETYSFQNPNVIAKNYATQAKASATAVEMFVACELEDENDYILEGYHITPKLVDKLNKKYGSHNFKAVFLLKYDIDAFVKNVEKSTTPNDWILEKTNDPKTFTKIGEMIRECSVRTKKESAALGLRNINMDIFEEGMEKALKHFV